MVELEVGPRSGDGNGTQGQKIRRPAVIVSNDGANEAASAPRTPRGDRRPRHLDRQADLSLSNVFAGGVDRPPQDGTAQAEQIRWIDAAYVRERVGVLPPAILIALNDAMRLHLSL